LWLERVEEPSTSETADTNNSIEREAAEAIA
jgi:hypothetical protein